LEKKPLIKIVGEKDTRKKEEKPKKSKAKKEKKPLIKVRVKRREVVFAPKFNVEV